VPACWTAFDPSLPDEYVLPLRDAADDLSSFLTLPPDPDLLNRWAALLPWLEARLCDDRGAFIDFRESSGDADDAIRLIGSAYARWAERRGFGCELFHETNDGRAGAWRVNGPFAFAWLRGESGLHRIIRQATRDGVTRREAAFVAVRVVPDVEGLMLPALDEQQLRLDTIRHLNHRTQHT
jgi:peptide chain release factor 2